jgi:hypothetical protein
MKIIDERISGRQRLHKALTLGTLGCRSHHFHTARHRSNWRNRRNWRNWRRSRAAAFRNGSLSQEI